MLISPALAHGASGAEVSGGGVFPLVLLAAVMIFVLIFVGQNRWRKFKSKRDSLGH
jgi:hypothetical protein